MILFGCGNNRVSRKFICLIERDSWKACDEFINPKVKCHALAHMFNLKFSLNLGCIRLLRQIQEEGGGPRNSDSQYYEKNSFTKKVVKRPDVINGCSLSWNLFYLFQLSRSSNHKNEKMCQLKINFLNLSLNTDFRIVIRLIFVLMYHWWFCVRTLFHKRCKLLAESSVDTKFDTIFSETLIKASCKLIFFWSFDIHIQNINVCHVWFRMLKEQH